MKREVKRLFVLLLTAVTFIFPFALQAQAYDSSTPTYFRPYALYKNIKYVPSYKFGATSISHMNEALYQWNEATIYGYLGREPTLRHYTNNYPVEEDDDNSIFYDDNNYIYHQDMKHRDFIAQNTIQPLGGSVVTSDIVINMNYTWANSAQPGKLDLWSAFLHEAGHTLGLGDHRYIMSSVMYATLGYNTVKRYLHDYDVFSLDKKGYF